jgi:hypothetical protein
MCDKVYFNQVVCSLGNVLLCYKLLLNNEIHVCYLVSFNEFCKINNDQDGSLDQSVESLYFIRKVQQYLGGNAITCFDDDNLQVKESINKMINYVEDKNPFHCI